MSEWIEIVNQHGIPLLITLVLIVTLVQCLRGLAATAKTYFSSDGVITKWFITDSHSREKMAEAMTAMPVAIDAMKAATLEHRVEINDGIKELVILQEKTTRNVSQATQLDGLFSTHYTNRGLLKIVEAAKDAIEHNDTGRAMVALRDAEVELRKGLGQRDGA